METRDTDPTRLRREDPALLTGAAQYTDDHRPAGLVHAAFLRCPYGHARVERVDRSAAVAIDGVIDVLDAAELAARGGPTGIATGNYFPGPDEIERPLLVGDRARFAGDPVAVVLAEDRYVAGDALAAIDVEYERLPAVTDPREAVDGDGPSIGDATADTVEWSVGDRVAVEAAFDAADRTVAVDVDMPRVISAPMEPRAVLAEPAGEENEGVLTVTTSSQTPHRDRNRIADTLGLPSDGVRVIVPAVGGGFGPKGARPYPEGPLVAWCATQLDRPIKWAGTRTEAQQSDHQGRGLSVDCELAVDADGTARALRIRGAVAIGGYPVRGPSSAIKSPLVTGPYDIPTVHCELVGALTNTVPLGPYRGAGRPEAIFIVERLLDRAASVLGIDPAAIRRRNFLPPEAFPHETPLGSTYDSGDYAGALDLALDAIDYDARRRDQDRGRQDGRFLGIGLASFVENTGSTRTESARVAVDADGRVTAAAGTADSGQGHATTFARLVADELGVDADDVTFRDGDTGLLDEGTGTFGCRSVPVGGSALVECARDVVEMARDRAADALETAPGDLRFQDGAFHVRGAPDRSVSLASVAQHAAEAGSPLTSERLYEPDGYVFAFGTHAAVVEVTPETGDIAVRRYLAVDDCGIQLHPTLVDGQVHGGVAQGLGQALREAAVYDQAGSLLTGSFQDYAVHRAASMPELETASTVTPSPVTPHGAKGVGEAGTIAAPPALVNAVLDALAPLGVEDVSMPLTPETVRRAIVDAG